MAKMESPNLIFMYHLEAEMSAEDFHIGEPFAAGQRRVVMNILGGSAKGPAFNGRIERLGGADWGVVVNGTKVCKPTKFFSFQRTIATSINMVDPMKFMKLDARYTIKTDDGEYLYIRARGIFTPKTGHKLDDLSTIRNLGQDEVEWFSHLRIEAGSGKYNWLNSVVAIGVMSMRDRKICIDAYRLTNFPNQTPPNIKAKLS